MLAAEAQQVSYLADELRLGPHRFAPFELYEPIGTPNGNEPAVVPNGKTIALHHGLAMQTKIGEQQELWGHFPLELAKLGYRVIAIGLAEEERSAFERFASSCRVAGRAAVQSSMMPPLAPLIWMNAGSRIMNEERPVGTATLGRYARDAAAVSREVIGGPTIDLGLSWGGARAQQKAADFPDETEQVIVVASLPAFPVVPVDFPQFGAVKTIISPRRNHEAIGNVYGGRFRDPNLLEDHPHLRDIAARKIHLLTQLQQEKALMLGFPLAWRNCAKVALGIYDMPTDIIIGDDDPIMPKGTVRLAANLLGADTYLLEGGGHGDILALPRDFAELVDGIVTKRALEKAV